jgi:hypothetical protein
MRLNCNLTLLFRAERRLVHEDPLRLQGLDKLRILLDERLIRGGWHVAQRDNPFLGASLVERDGD